MWYGVMHVEPGPQHEVQPGLVGIAVVVVPRRTTKDDPALFMALVADLQAPQGVSAATSAMLEVARATAARVSPEDPGRFRIDRCRWIMVDPQGYFDEAVIGMDGQVDWHALPGELPRSLHALLAIDGGPEAWQAFQRIPDVGDLSSVIEAQSELRRIGGRRDDPSDAGPADGT
jgi:hypothetical protein